MMFSKLSVVSSLLCIFWHLGTTKKWLLQKTAYQSGVLGSQQKLFSRLWIKQTSTNHKKMLYSANESRSRFFLNQGKMKSAILAENSQCEENGRITWTNNHVSDQRTICELLLYVMVWLWEFCWENCADGNDLVFQKVQMEHFTTKQHKLKRRPNSE